MAGFLDAARQILEEAGEPLHGLEIVKRGRERNLFTSRAKDDWALVRTITSDVKRGNNSRHMVILGKGYYGLEDWGVSRANPPVTEAPRARRSPQPTTAVPPGITLEKLERIRQVMTVDEFRQDWGDIYDQLLAAERARAVTPLNDRYLLERIRPLFQRIQDFLQGRGNESPKSEVICDWIFICYTLEMFREGAALWRCVNKDEVNAWQYERTAKFSTACRTRVG
jgi:hypothetical protein